MDGDVVLEGYASRRVLIHDLDRVYVCYIPRSRSQFRGEKLRVEIRILIE